MKQRLPNPDGSDSPEWIPAESLMNPALMNSALLNAGPKPTRKGPGRLVAGFTTALPRLPDRDLAPRVARLIPGFAEKERGDTAFDNTASGNAGTGKSGREPLLLAQVHAADILETGRSGSEQSEQDSWSSSAFEARYDDEGRSMHRFDGATATAERPRWLGVKTADCVPLLAVAVNANGRDGGGGEPGQSDPPVFAALHVGWRGAAAGIVENLIHHWEARGHSPRDVRMVLGPHIGGCCYEVGDDCLEAFDPAHLIHAVNTHAVTNRAVKNPDGKNSGGKPHLDLAAVIREQARRLGVAASHITGVPWCTRCHQPDSQQLDVQSPDVQRPPPSSYRFASYRAALARDQPLTTTNVAVIGLL